MHLDGDPRGHKAGAIARGRRERPARVAPDHLIALVHARVARRGVPHEAVSQRRKAGVGGGDAGDAPGHVCVCAVDVELRASRRRDARDAGRAILATERGVAGIRRGALQRGQVVRDADGDRAGTERAIFKRPLELGREQVVALQGTASSVSLVEISDRQRGPIEWRPETGHIGV